MQKTTTIIVALCVSALLKVALADFDIRDFGSRPGAGALCTAAIQKAIDAAEKAGGGRVLVAGGVYKCGTIRLKSKVDLHIAKGAVLLGGAKSDDYDDFPADVCSLTPEGSAKTFVCAWDANDIAITGEGTIDGQGPEFFDKNKKWGSYWAKPPHPRPRMVQFVRCKGIRLEGVTFKDSPCWTMLIRKCRDIAVSRIKVTADQHMINNDGIDFDACTNVRVGECEFTTGDDCIILRAMREIGETGKVVCEDVVVSNCVLNSACQMVRMGCPSDDTIRNALFKNISGKCCNGVFFDYPERYLRAADEGYMDIGGIVFDGIKCAASANVLQIIVEPGVKIRRAGDIVFRNIEATTRDPIKFIGNKFSVIGPVTVENSSFKVEKAAPFVAVGIKGLRFKDVKFEFKGGETNFTDKVIKFAPGSDKPLKREKSVSWESVKRRG